MFRTFLNTYTIGFAEGVNALIYFLKKLPIIGKHIPETLYGKTDTKNKFAIFFGIIKVLFGFFNKSFYLFITIFIPGILMQKFLNVEYDLLDISLYIFVILNYIVGSLMNGELFSINKSDYKMLNLMRVNPREYFLGKIIYRIISSIVFFLPALSIIGFGIVKGLLILFQLSMCRVIGEWICLIIYKKYKVILSKNGIISVSTLLLSVLISYPIPIVRVMPNIALIIFNPLFSIALFIISTIIGLKLWNYKGYTRLARETINKETLINQDELMSDINFADVKIDEKKMDKELLNSDKFKNKFGYDYLNELFFYRHKKIVEKAIKIRVYIICTAFIIILGIIFFKPDEKQELLRLIYGGTPYLVFIMYLLSTTQRICKAMFYNCDISLLRYKYYREGDALLRTFKLRLKKLLYFNSIPALFICLFLQILVLVSNGNEILKLIPIFICTIVLAIFFSVYHLFLYYILQPYTSELTVKSPLFNIANGLAYFLSYMCLRLKVSSLLFTFGVIGITLLFIVLAIVLVYRIAPKTFKLK